MYQVNFIVRKVFALIWLALFLSAFPAGAQVQEIKKWKVSELETYIKDCDHPLIINFWATYCTPCITEIPYFQNAVAQYKYEEVELLLVSLDPPGYNPSRIADFAKKKQFISRIIWLNEKNAANSLPKIDSGWSGGLPSSLFINNKANYRRFYDRQLTELQVAPAVRLMIGH
ncbi:TlpA disulfide reductase family protein [Flavitalea flava]